MKNKNTVELKKNIPGSDRFLKLVSPEYVKTLLKEAKSVGYLITQDDMSFKVHDDGTGDIVFDGIRVNYGSYAVHFSKLYWVEPQIEVGAL
jgi:hypothetical protein